MVACGAIAAHVADVVARNGWPVDTHPLPPLLHNRPAEIAPAVRTLVQQLSRRYRRVAVAYADCGTYGALDSVCRELGVSRLRGDHCYDVFAGAATIRRLLAEEPGTYLLTDYLVRTFSRSVVVELGLDRWPELHAAYFGNYRRVVWLTQHPDPELTAAAERAAAVLHLPLSVVPTGSGGLERELASMLGPGYW